MGATPSAGLTPRGDQSEDRCWWLVMTSEQAAGEDGPGDELQSTVTDESPVSPGGFPQLFCKSHINPQDTPLQASSAQSSQGL